MVHFYKKSELSLVFNEPKIVKSEKRHNLVDHLRICKLWVESQMRVVKDSRFSSHHVAS